MQIVALGDVYHMAKQNRWSKKIVTGMIVVAMGILLQQTVVYASETTSNKMDKRVLFISSYSYSWETVPDQMQGLEEALTADYSIDYEFMDTKNTTYSEDY